MTEKFQNLVTGVMALCALTVTGMLIKRQFSATPAEPVVEDVRDWKPFAAAGQRMGPANAPISIVEFSDFQCPFCAQAARTLKDLRARDPRVAVIYRHFPLDNHPHAFNAAIAATCAGRQGQFEAFHNVLFARQDSIGILPWQAFAVRAGVKDTDGFERCMNDPAVRAEVSRDRRAALGLGLRGTPSFIVNGKMFTGSVPPDGWSETIESVAKD